MNMAVALSALWLVFHWDSSCIFPFSIETWLRGRIICMSFRLLCSPNLGKGNSSSFINFLKDRGSIKQFIACFLHPTRKKMVPIAIVLLLMYSVLHTGFVGSLKGCDTKRGSMRKKKGDGKEGVMWVSIHRE